MGRGTLICAKTDGQPWLRGLQTNSTSTAFPSLVNTLTRPATVQGDYFTVACGQYSDLALCPFGEGADDSTFDFRIVGWSQVVNGMGNSTPVVWKPTTIFRGTATLSTSVGVADATQTDVERDADTITAGSPVITPSLYTIYSPADNTPAMLIINVLDFELMAVYFDRTGATAANLNYRWIGG